MSEGLKARGRLRVEAGDACVCGKSGAESAGSLFMCLSPFFRPQGQNCLLYTTSTSKITVKGLGLIPTSRNFKVECTVLRKWGENPLTLSDCYGRFFKG
jgi:hypothetical protein